MIRIISLALSVNLILSAASASSAVKAESFFDDTKIEVGSVGARYVPEPEKRIKTRVAKESDKYDYDLFGRSIFEYFPLQLGSGKYKVAIFENIADSRYRQVKVQDLEAIIKDPMTVYLASVQTVNWNKDMAVIKKAQELTKNLKTDSEKINAIYRYVVNTLKYDYEKIKTKAVG